MELLIIGVRCRTVWAGTLRLPLEEMIGEFVDHEAHGEEFVMHLFSHKKSTIIGRYYQARDAARPEGNTFSGVCSGLCFMGH